MPLAPSGELTSLGLARESAFGVANASPSVYAISADPSFNGMNEFLDRPGARKRVGRTRPATGMYLPKGSFTAEADPDNIGALLQLGMGAETVAANASNPSAQTVNTTSTTAIAAPLGSTVPGWQYCTPAAMTGITVGQSLTIDTAGQAETVVVKAIVPQGAPTQFYAYFTKAHAAGAAIANGSVVLAYDHRFTLGSPRPSFTAQLNRVIDATNNVGCKVSDMSFAISEKQILMAKVGCEYQAEYRTTTPQTPSFSTLAPFRFESTSDVVTIDGTQSDASIQEASVDINTGLITDYPAFGTGRLRAGFPETVTKVSGTMKLAFETETLLQKFWGNLGATGPQSYVIPIALAFNFVSEEFVNTAVPYALRFLLPQCFVSSVDIPIAAASYLTQSVKFECYESTNGAGDDVSMVLTNASSGLSI